MRACILFAVGGQSCLSLSLSLSVCVCVCVCLELVTFLFSNLLLLRAWRGEKDIYCVLRSFVSPLEIKRKGGGG
ncbi:hypothetical protein F5Y14DRAFT_402017 [Nemania sp. NC0429]|nr:hypothetical protein F5Y14DRAFT_402017 [Nemania sp. NC0429]